MSSHRVELVSAILILPLVLDHMKVVATGGVCSSSLLADDGILTAAKVIALHLQRIFSG